MEYTSPPVIDFAILFQARESRAPQHDVPVMGRSYSLAWATNNGDSVDGP